MQSNVAICIIILCSIAFVIIAWTFFSRRRKEFKHALLVTHNTNQHQIPLQQTRDVIPEPRSSVPTQSSSTSSDDTVVELRRAKTKSKSKSKSKKARVQGRLDKTHERTGGIGHVEEPTVTVRSEDKIGAPTSKDHCEPEDSGQSVAAVAAAPIDPVGGSWGDAVNTTQEKESRGGWGEDNANTGATSAW